MLTSCLCWLVSQQSWPFTELRKTGRLRERLRIIMLTDVENCSAVQAGGSTEITWKYSAVKHRCTYIYKSIRKSNRQNFVNT